MLNIIQIINFVWAVSKNKIDKFHKTLLKLGIMFSYALSNQKDVKKGFDYDLLARVPNIVYDFIAKNGDKSFKTTNNFIFEEDFLQANKSDSQI